MTDRQPNANVLRRMKSAEVKRARDNLRRLRLAKAGGFAKCTHSGEVSEEQLGKLQAIFVKAAADLLVGDIT